MGGGGEICILTSFCLSTPLPHITYHIQMYMDLVIGPAGFGFTRSFLANQVIYRQPDTCQTRAIPDDLPSPRDPGRQDKLMSFLSCYVPFVCIVTHLYEEDFFKLKSRNCLCFTPLLPPLLSSCLYPRVPGVGLRSVYLTSSGISLL